jgi:hypothetical protein
MIAAPAIAARFSPFFGEYPWQDAAIVPIGANRPAPW